MILLDIAIECGSREIIENAAVYFSSANHTINSTAVFTCDVGFLAGGDAVSRCLPDGSWSEVDYTCDGTNTSLMEHKSNGIVIEF